MLHINTNKKTMGRKAVRWQIMTIAFLSVFMGIFCFSQTAKATDYEISIADAANVTEGTAAVFAVTLDTPIAAGDTVTVNYNMVDGFAVAPGDYDNTGGTLTFNTVGQTTQNITVPTVNDTVVETSEDFMVNLSGETVTPSGGNDVDIDVGSASCNILPDGDQFSLSVTTPQQAGEGFNIQFTVTVNHDIDLSVPVTFNLSDGTATGGGVDYDSSPQMHLFGFPVTAGSTRVFNVPTNNDPAVEADEEFSVSVSSPLPEWDGTPATGTRTQADRQGDEKASRDPCGGPVRRRQGTVRDQRGGNDDHQSRRRGPIRLAGRRAAHRVLALRLRPDSRPDHEHADRLQHADQPAGAAPICIVGIRAAGQRVEKGLPGQPDRRGRAGR